MCYMLLGNHSLCKYLFATFTSYSTNLFYSNTHSVTNLFIHWNI